jgi:hypothetical protein
VVLASVADVKSAEVLRAPTGTSKTINPRDDGDKKEFVAGESTKETVKTIARGKPGDFRNTRGDYRVLTTNAHGLRVLRAPGFPCALCFSRVTNLHNSGASCRENAKVFALSLSAPSAVMPRFKRGIQYAAASRRSGRPLESQAGRRRVCCLKFESETCAHRQPWRGDRRPWRQPPISASEKASPSRTRHPRLLVPYRGAGALDHRRLHRIR